MSVFDDFFVQYNNQSVEYSDPSNPYQCMDLAGKWCEKLGIPYESIRHLYAKDVFLAPTSLTRQYFDIIKNVTNDPNSKPVKGDLVVFGTQVGYAGHISLEPGLSTGYNLTTFDQNWDTPHFYHIDAQGKRIPYCRLVTHTAYFGCLGWLHPKAIVPPAPIDYKALCLQVKQQVNAGDSDTIKVIKIRELVAKV